MKAGMDSLNISLLHKYFTSVTAIAGYLGLSIVTESPNGSFSSGEIPLKCMITRGTSIQETPILQNIDRRSGAPCLSAQRGLQTTRARRSARWDPWHIEDVDRDGPKAVGQQIFARKFSWFIVWSSFSQKNMARTWGSPCSEPIYCAASYLRCKMEVSSTVEFGQTPGPGEETKISAVDGTERERNQETSEFGKPRYSSLSYIIYLSIHPSIYLHSFKCIYICIHKHTYNTYVYITARFYLTNQHQQVAVKELFPIKACYPFSGAVAPTEQLFSSAAATRFACTCCIQLKKRSESTR